MRAIAPRGRVNHVRRKNGIRREARGASFALWTSAGVQKSRTGREISCQLQSAIDRGRERRSEGGNERSVTGTEGGGRARVRIVRGRGGRDDEGERLKSPGLLAWFMRDSSDATRKKENSPSLCASPRAPRPPYPSRFSLLRSSRVVWKWKWPGRIVPLLEISRFQEHFPWDRKKNGQEELTPAGLPLPEVICQDTVINVNRRNAGMVECRLEREAWNLNFFAIHT